MVQTVKYILLLFLIMIFSACGESVVEIGPSTYIPKIVVEGYLSPGKKVENIRITRNFPLNVHGNPLSLILFSADVRLVDLQSNMEYKLTFNPEKISFEYNGNDLEIGYGKSYRLNVSASFEGQTLSTSAVTITPNKGFEILKEESKLGEMKYREKDNSGNVKNFRLVFTPSTGSNFYAVSIVALDADLSTFIYDNAYFEVKEENLRDYFDNYKYEFKWLQNVNSNVDKIQYDIEWLDTWFYGNYRTVVYAGDENYRLFTITYNRVQEFDGNFHEPRMNLEGDGIGVFGSFIADTVYFKILK